MQQNDLICEMLKESSIFIYRNDFHLHHRLSELLLYILLFLKTSIPIVMKHLLFFSLLLITFSSCSTSKMASLTLSKTIEMDGSNKDWPELTLFDKKSSLVYGVYNDDTFVYLFIKTADRMTQRKLLQGITVWFNPFISKNKTMGIHYPFLPIRLSESLRRETDQDPDILIILRSLPREAELVDKKADKTSILYLDERNDEINVAIGFSNETNEMIYELRIPRQLSSGEKLTKEMTLILETNEMKIPTSGMRPESDLGGMTGDNRPDGGMGRRGMREGSRTDARSDFDPISLRLNVVLNKME